jgi:hypothetical protein
VVARKYERACNRAKTSSGILEAKEAVWYAGYDLQGTCLAIKAAAVSTLAGLAIKARAMQALGTVEDWSPQQAASSFGQALAEDVVRIFAKVGA